MSSSYFSADLGSILSTGQALTGISGTVETGSQFREVSGADAYEEITSAIGEFRDKWDNAVHHISNAIGTLGTTTAAVGRFMTEHDNDMSAAWDSGLP